MEAPDEDHSRLWDVADDFWHRLNRVQLTFARDNISNDANHKCISFQPHFPAHKLSLLWACGEETLQIDHAENRPDFVYRNSIDSAMEVSRRLRVCDDKVIEAPMQLKILVVCGRNHRNIDMPSRQNSQGMRAAHVSVNQIESFAANPLR